MAALRFDLLVVMVSHSHTHNLLPQFFHKFPGFLFHSIFLFHLFCFTTSNLTKFYGTTNGLGETKALPERGYDLHMLYNSYCQNSQIFMSDYSSIGKIGKII